MYHTLINFLRNKVGIGLRSYLILLPLQPATEVMARGKREIKEGMRFEIGETKKKQRTRLKKVSIIIKIILRV